MTLCGPLVQIRRVYSAEWENLAFSVESGASQWTVRVEEASTHRLLYAAHRVGVAAARVAAAEFGIFRVLGPASPVTPEDLASNLSWSLRH